MISDCRITVSSCIAINSLISNCRVITSSCICIKRQVSSCRVIVSSCIAKKSLSSYCRINISSNTETSLLELFLQISEILQIQIEPNKLSPREGDVLQSRLDNSRAAELLGWQPEISLTEGLRMSISGHA